MNTRTVTEDDIGRITSDIIDTVDDWFSDRPLSTHDFLDRLELTLITSYQIDLGSNTDSPVIKTIMRIARKAKRDHE